MVKIYLRYSLKTTFGVVTSFPSNIVFDGTGKCAITGALEHVLIWDLKKGAKIASYSDTEVKKQPVVSHIALSPDKVHLATGYDFCLPLRISDFLFPTGPTLPTLCISTMTVVSNSTIF